MTELGRIVRLQVQVAPLKRGERPERWYDPERIRRVDALTVTDHGVLGHGDDEQGDIVDVHHRDHPESRYRGDNGISISTTGHYEIMREQFGAHLTDGIAAENVIIERAGWLDVTDLADGVRVIPGGAATSADTGARPPVEAGLELHGARPAEPCVEFSRLVAGPGVSLREPLQQLRGGTRGYLLQVRSGAGTVLREGDLVESR